MEILRGRQRGGRRKEGEEGEGGREEEGRRKGGGREREREGGGVEYKEKGEDHSKGRLACYRNKATAISFMHLITCSSR